MSAYIDNARIKYRGMYMSHMIADTLDELHAMATILKVRKHFQDKKGKPHYDVCASNRLLAIKNGAIPVPIKEIVLKLRDMKKIIVLVLMLLSSTLCISQKMKTEDYISSSSFPTSYTLTIGGEGDVVFVFGFSAYFCDAAFDYARLNRDIMMCMHHKRRFGGSFVFQWDLDPKLLKYFDHERLITRIYNEPERQG